MWSFKFTPSLKWHAAAAVLIAAAIMACFSRLALHPGSVLIGPQTAGDNDLTNYYIGSRAMLRDAVLDENAIPAWNPQVGLGLPYVGNPQSALYYPPNWLTIVLNPEWSLSWLLLAHHWWGGFGAYVLGRRNGLSWSASLLSGVAFACAPFLIAQSAEGHYGQLTAVSWAPWAFLAFEFLLDTRRLPARLAVAGCLALSFFCGHPQETYYLVILLTGCAGLETIRLWRAESFARARELAWNWCLTGMLTFGLVAIDLLPIFFNSRMGMRPSLQNLSGEFGWGAFTLSHVQQLLSPFAIDRPDNWIAGTPPFWEKLGYFGIVPLILALSAVVLSSRQRFVRRMMIIAVATYLFALGTNGLIYPLAVKLFPGMSMFRLPSRVLFITSFAVAVLAGAGFDALWSLAMRSRWRSVSVVTALTACLMAGWAALTWSQRGLAPVELQAPLFWMLLAAPLMFAALAGAGRSPRWQFASLTLLLAACIVDFAALSHQVTDTARYATLDERNPELLAQLQQANQVEDRSRVLAIQEVLTDRDAARFGIDKVRGYDPAGPAASLLMIDQLHRPGTKRVEPMGFTPADVAELEPALLDLLGVRYALQFHRPDQRLPAPDGWTIALSTTLGKRTIAANRRERQARARIHVDVLENHDPLPRAFIVGQARIAQSWEDAELLKQTDFRREVLLSEDVLPAGPRASFRPARLLKYGNDSIELEATLDAPGYLVVSDLWYPGWSAHVSGKELRILKANLAFRAIPLPAGTHRLTMTFTPPGWVIGSTLTLLTLLIVLWCLLVPRSNTAENFPDERLVKAIDQEELRSDRELAEVAG